VTRRAAYKAEKTVQDHEKGKHGQDHYIDNLNAEKRQLEQKIVLTEAQLKAQKVQTDEAKKILAETASDMELITFEKKQLMQQWKASIINLRKRDEAVAATAKQLQETKSKIGEVEAEITGTERDKGKAHETHEAQEESIGKLLSEDATITTAIQQTDMEREQGAERYNMIQKSMEQTDEEEKKTNAQGKNIGTQLDTVVQNIQVVTKERQKLEKDILSQQGEQLTVSKSVKKSRKVTQQHLQTAHEKEREAAQLDYEVSLIRVDILNTDAHNTQLKEVLDKHTEDLKEKDKLIEKYQLEIRQRSDEIEKKMYRVDRLNRKYEQLVKAAGGSADKEAEMMGPLEMMIRRHKTDVEKTNEECTELQRKWLEDQTALVEVVSETEDNVESNSEMQARSAILAEQKQRLSNEEINHAAEVKRLKHLVEVLHNDKQRMNELIASNKKLEGDLENTNGVMQLEFVNELKELEHTSIDLEIKIQAAKAGKAEVLDEIMEMERQLMLWEKKIQLEKDTRDALDPEAGTKEIAAMEQEIHRMQLRQQVLKVEQERMIKEMEQAVLKRETIALRMKGKKAKMGGANGVTTQAQSARQLKKLKRSMKETLRAAAEHSHHIKGKMNDINGLTKVLQSETERYGELEEELEAKQKKINSMLYEKRRHTEIHGRHQRMEKRYKALEQGDRPSVSEDGGEDEKVIQRLFLAERDGDNFRSVVKVLAGRFEHLEEVFIRLGQLSSD